MQITAGKLKSRRLLSPKTGLSGARPTLSKTRQAIFNALAAIMDFEEKSFLDMFSGSGIMGLEAFSRGFEPIFAIEKDKKTYELIKENYKLLGAEQNLVFGDAIQKTKKLEQKFDVIFIDPPYKQNLYNPSLEAILTGKILKKDGIVILEHPKDEIINFENFEIIKQKAYSNTLVTFLALK